MKKKKQDVMTITDGHKVHHLAENANQTHRKRLSKVEKVCAWVCDKTGSPTALIAVSIIQIVWIVLGQFCKFDPYPFAFLLTVSNVIQLILIFVLAVGQRQSAKRSEVRAETDHKSISYMLHHQDLQEKMLIAIMEKLDIDSENMKNKIDELNK
jgi:uncharacterized membrane protein